MSKYIIGEIFGWTVTNKNIDQIFLQNAAQIGEAQQFPIRFICKIIFKRKV